MKKISIVLVLIILVVIAVLPLVGNKFMQKYTEEALNLVTAQGVKLTGLQTSSSYLSTKKHFEFTVEDSKAFVNFINAHTSDEFLVVTGNVFKGAVIGVDLAYSNLPFAKSIDVESYLLGLPTVTENRLKTEDVNFYNKFTAFLKNKGVLYHLEYNLINSKFKSYVKDIDQKYQLQNGSEVNIKLLGIAFKGEGDVDSPSSLATTIKNIYLDVNQTDVQALLSLRDFHALNKFVSFSDYTTSLGLKSMNFLIKGTGNDLNVSVEGLQTSSKVVPHGKSVNMYTKSNVDALHLRSVPLSLDVERFQSEVKEKGFEREALEQMSEMISKTDDINMLSQQKEFQDTVIRLLSKGFTIDVINASLEKLVLNQTENLGGIKAGLNLDIKEDENLSEKMQRSPLLFLSNIMLDADLKLSEAMYEKILQKSSMAQRISSYAQKEKESVVFKIEFKDAKLLINGKTIQ